MWDNPWLYVLFLIVLAVLIIMGLSFLVSLIVSVAARRYSAKTRDTYQKRIVALLPCDDCGECGYSGCQEFAVEVFRCWTWCIFPSRSSVSVSIPTRCPAGCASGS